MTSMDFVAKNTCQFAENCIFVKVYPIITFDFPQFNM